MFKNLIELIESDKEGEGDKFNELVRNVVTHAWLGLKILVGVATIAYILPLFEISELGAVGDFIGGIANPFLTFGSIVLLIYSIRFQVAELKLTRTELKETKEVHALSVEQQRLNMLLPYALNNYKVLLEDFKNMLNEEHICRLKEKPYSKAENTVNITIGAIIRSSTLCPSSAKGSLPIIVENSWRRIIVQIANDDVKAQWDLRHYMSNQIGNYSRNAADTFEILESARVPVQMYNEAFDFMYNHLQFANDITHSQEYERGATALTLKKINNSRKVSSDALEILRELRHKIPSSRSVNNEGEI